MTTETVTLESQTRKTHEARRRLATIRGAMTGRAGAGLTEHGRTGLQELRDDAELMLIAEEDTLRALAVAAFHATGQSHVSPGITVTEERAWDLNPLPGEIPRPYIVPRVTFADDLGAALDAAAQQAQTPEIWR